LEAAPSNALLGLRHHFKLDVSHLFQGDVVYHARANLSAASKFLEFLDASIAVRSIRMVYVGSQAREHAPAILRMRAAP